MKANDHEKDSGVHHTGGVSRAEVSNGPGSSPVVRAPGGSRRLPSQRAVLALQRSHGNRFVQRLLDNGGHEDGRVPFQTEMEATFGEDFSGVQVTTGQQSSLADLGGSAATSGESVQFAEHQPDRETVAHELAHVVQDRRATTSPAGGVGDIDSAAECEAMTAGAAALAGEQVDIRQAPDAATQLRRAPDRIVEDYLVAMADFPQDMPTLLGLLREAERAHAAATRRVLPTGAGDAPGYRAAADTIRASILSVSETIYMDAVGTPKIVLNGHKMAGMGDLVLARKVAEALVADGCEVWIVSNEVGDMQRMAPAFNGRITSSGEPLPARFRQAQVFVHVGGEAGSKENFPTLGLDPGRTQLVKLLEYGFSEQARNVNAQNEDMKRAFGLAPEELGIFVDEDLRGRAAEGTDELTGIDARAQELRAITKDEVKETLFGKTDPTLAECREYLNTVDLYFGYAHTQSAVNQFLNMVLGYEVMLADASKNRIDIFAKVKFPSADASMVNMAPGDLDDLRAAFADTQEELAEATRERPTGDHSGLRSQVGAMRAKLQFRESMINDRVPILRALGVRSVQLITPTRQQAYDMNALYGIDGAKELRIIDLFGLDPADFQRLLVASGDLAMLTGDQSFSEGVSANKILFYEQFGHKVPLFQSWLAIARDQIVPNDALVRFLELYPVVVAAGGMPRDRRNLLLEDLRGALRDPVALREQFSALNAYVAAEGNAAAGAVATIRSAIPASNPLAARRDAMLATITRSSNRQRRDLGREIMAQAR